MKNKLLLISTIIFFSLRVSAQNDIIVDGSAYYNLPPKSIMCKIIDCPAHFKEFKGIWSGKFEAYDQKSKKFRPYFNHVGYDGHCYQNIKNGEIFVVGHQVDSYPAFNSEKSKTDSSLLITGIKANEKSEPFLRTIDKTNGLVEYHKVFGDKPSGMVIWEYNIQQKEQQPEMTFRVVDYNNVFNEKSIERSVFISMTVGPMDHPYWEGVVAKGNHSRAEK